jgi:Ca2+-binding EF-hand superfamily protein
MLICLLATDVAAQSRRAMRFRNLDRNNDGVITRAEWKGSDRAFDQNDWNGDGILSGDEVERGARRPTAEIDDDFYDWTEAGFAALDTNRDDRITAREWRHNREAFERADHDGDNVVTRREFLNEDGPAARGAGRTNRFFAWDRDGDGMLSRAEWRGTAQRFQRLDANQDGRLTTSEFAGGSRDDATVWTGAYRAGYQRGVAEGRQASREDFARRHWDLEGQRELQQADSGYQPAHGSRSEYQAGYREGFRFGYSDQWAR